MLLVMFVREVLLPTLNIDSYVELAFSYLAILQ